MNFESHFHLAHCLAGNASPVLVKEKGVRCQLCGQNVLADAETFRRHLRNDHKEIALENYFAECVKGKDADGARKTGEEEVNQMCQVLDSRLDSPKKKTRLNKTEIKRNKREALNQCKFQCPSCQSVFSSWKDLRAHRREKSCSQCRPSQRGVTVKKVVLKCLLCKKEVLSDHFLFRIHLNKHHGLANVDWYQLEVAGKGKEYKHRNVRRNKPHQRSKLKVSVPLVNSPLEKQVMPPKSLPNSLMTASVSSLCQFKCTRCTFEHFGQFLSCMLKGALGTELSPPLLSRRQGTTSVAFAQHAFCVTQQ